MAGNDAVNQEDVNNPSNVRRSSDLLPGYHRTDKNIKFLASTLDQFIQQPQLERINGFVGSKLSLNYNPATDTYIDGGSPLRNAYQLEPALVVKDVDNVISRSVGYDDLINQLQANNANTSDLDRLFRPESVSYDPNIDWDKFVNFRQYYWMPTGPDSIEITGHQQSITTTYTVVDSSDGKGLLFTPDGLTVTPLLTLYRGVTYTFNVTSKYPFYIKTAYVKGAQNLYPNVLNQGTKNGSVTITVDDTTPNVLFYFAEGNDYAIGQIAVRAITEDTLLDIENEIIGKISYGSPNGVTFTNGMKVHFTGNVTPSSYLNKDWFVEGVGSAITLVDYDSLTNIGSITTNLDTNFDGTPFDVYPFDDFSYIPLTPEYVTINRAALDKNSWSRYNRWVHQDVIAATAVANGVTPVYDSTMRAQRPIIEFTAGLQLFNFGARAKTNIDLIDTTTKNAFRTFEGSPGFYIDGIFVEHGFRVIFNADTDSLVNGKVYTVKYVSVNGNQVVNLEESDDSVPDQNDAVVVTRGNQYGGTNWWYNGSEWLFAQQKTVLNQQPLFGLYDDNGNEFSDINFYNSSFKGTGIFGYAVGAGTPDSVLGFPLQYKNVADVGDYLFKNYFTSDTFTNFTNDQLEILTVAGNYLKVNTLTGSYFKDVWVKSVDRPIPIIQFQVVEQPTKYIELIAIDNPGHTNDLVVEVFVNSVKQIHNVDYRISRKKARAYVVSITTFSSNDRVQINLYTSKTPNSNGYYEVPINLTNNPLNGPISDFTFTELSDHVNTIVNNNPNFVGTFPGTGNLRDLSNLSEYGTRLVSHQTPISFAHYFLGTKDNNLIDAIRKISFDYSQFKTNLIKQVALIKDVNTTAVMLDQAISAINSGKDPTFPYGYSDMLAYGSVHSDRTYTVTNSKNVQYSLESTFDTTILSERSILVYLNGTLLVKDRDYIVNQYSPSIQMIIPLTAGDTIVISDYSSTVGNYVPPTPTKLGLYPKFVPSIFLDDTYAETPQLVIQGHDGSIMIAFGDYRDDIILEFEKRVYNNLKSNYDSNLLDIYSIIPGAFRNTGYSLADINSLITPDFLKWIGFFGVDYQTNNTFDETNPFTFNYSSDIDTLKKRKLPGYWRAIYKFFYDTDRPHTNPWEMLGFTKQPSWWESVYGPAPYTSGNLILWKDLEAGNIAQGDNAGINPLYARPGLSKIIPVDPSGNLLSPVDSGLATTPIINPNDPARVVTLRSTLIGANWNVGDQGPAETSWRRSSYWPFACQILLALAKPSTYSAKFFDPSRLSVNKIGQYKYGTAEEYLDLSTVSLYRDTVNGVRVLSSGYSVFVIETGLVKDANYLTRLKSDLSTLDYNLMVKLGGFASKDKLQVTIDAVDPTSPAPGVLIASEDYQIFFNQSAPIQSIGISGIIVQKTERGFAVRGYDQFNPYFTILAPFQSTSGQAIHVGGKSETFVNWTQNTTYNAGQIVFYLDRYYRVTQKHNSDTTFTSAYYQSLPFLPTTGGVAVLLRTSFNTTPTIVPYGTEFTTIQEIYDLILGYGKWLTSNGFVFDQFISDLNQISDWNFTAKEFLYWSTQNWAVNSVITLSPFADKITFNSSTGVVDSLVNNNEYSILKANGSPLPQANFTITRLNGVFTLSTVNTQEGLFFARLNVIQKEHAIVFNNYTLFNDVVYDIGSGYRQRRISLKGFRTSNWNGDFFSPGFIFDQAKVVPWQSYADYTVGQVVSFSGNYYSALSSIPGTQSFDFTQWALLPSKPVSQLYPNFDYKINQFEDFYSLDIDNFDAGQQSAAQNLVGYIPRSYLDNIIGDPIAEYKFYQGYIREKGTINPLAKLSKSSLNEWQSSITANEEWAFRLGHYGGFNTYQELETNLDFTQFIENPQIVSFVENTPMNSTDAIYYQTPSDIVMSPTNFDITEVFSTVPSPYGFDDFQMPVAGYARYDDIFATVYNKNSILDIKNTTAIKEGSVFWLGFSENGSWDVLRYTTVPTNVIGVDLYIPGQTLIITTQDPTTLSVNDLIAINRVDPTIDSCYVVAEVLSPTQFTVFSTITILSPSIVTPIVGSLFHFKSSRLSNLDNLYALPYLERWKAGELIWVDDSGNGDWAVYQKTDNFQSFEYDLGTTVQYQHFGYNIATDDNTGTFVVSSPTYYDSIYGYRGRVYVLQRSGTDTVSVNFSYTVNTGVNNYYTGTTDTLLGSSLMYNGDQRLVIAGAPYASYVRSANSSTVVSTLSSTLHYINQGIVKISVLDPSNGFEDSVQVLTTPTPANSATFGTSVAYSPISATTGTLLVGAPGYNNNYGAVYIYNLTVANSATTIEYVSSLTTIIPNAQFGSSISGNNGLSVYAVSAPNYSSVLGNGSSGAVYVYTTSTTPIQIISGDNTDLPVPFGPSDTFGTVIKMSSDGNYLVIGSPQAADPVRNSTSGVVDIFAWNGTQFAHQQRIDPPITTNGTEFGYDIALSDDGLQLVISLSGASKTQVPTFDNYTVRLNATTATNTYGTVYVNDSTSALRKNITTFDSGSTKFYHGVTDTGSAHSYYRYGSNWAYSQELANSNVLSTSSFGTSISVTTSSVYIGAPSLLNAANSGTGQLFIFNKIDSSSTGWTVYREQEPLVDLSLIKNSSIINATTDQTQDYLDIIDPIKGKILGTATQELKYITAYDPAIYSIGINGTNVDVNSNWSDNHVGDLWWDLSAVRYVWYEQGELEYRKNNWNGIFPGSSIDVYEWVESPYLPSEWSQLADTADGLAQGISGQPRFSGNNVLSVKQVYNNISNAFTNVYYFWVKNKNVIPTSVKNRRMTALNVAQQIADPAGSGNQFLSILSPTALMVANSKELTGNQYNLKIEFDSITDAAKRHTEWTLIQENDANATINPLLEKKLIDSLLGRDSLGNPVPDPSLPSKLKYGVSIRPRQSLFVNRNEALRNLVEFTNNTLINLQVTGQIDFTNLNSKEPIPDASSYDVLVEDVYSLDRLSTSLLQTAELEAVIDSNGTVTEVIIINPGYGYITAPTITVGSQPSGNISEIIQELDASFTAVIDANGRVIEVIINNSGSGYLQAPKLTVRPFTVVVQTDQSSNGKWALYTRNTNNLSWNKIRTQSYDTTVYWEYVDWSSSDYDPLIQIFATVDAPYGLFEYQNSPAGTYIKVNNGGDGRYLIVRSTGGTGGTFDNNWDLVFSQNGTIQILSTLWNLSNTIYAWDEYAGWDQTEFDQAPEQEILYILTAIQKDIFVNAYKIYWNQFFFKAVRYAFSEQPYLDWAFKTTFINVNNSLGALDQRHTYKLQNSVNYQNFLEEIKPYHTKIRKYTESYTSTELTNTFNTDFDLPSYFNTVTQQFNTVGFGNELLLSDPWNTWYKNYSYGIESIFLYDGGGTYTSVPTVSIIPAYGDTGHGATAVAHISLGKVTSVIVTDPGAGYTAPPTIVFNGGGSTQLTPARAYARLGLNNVRKNNISIKFDRISTVREIGNQYFTDTFISDGATVDYNLTWVPVPEKSQITLTVNGVMKLIDDYSIVFSESSYSPQTNTSYIKNYAMLQLTFIPNAGDTIELTYPKDVSLYNALDRIADYYNPTSGMPGNVPDQLMSGMSFSGLVVDTIPFSAAGGWDVVPFGSSNWDNYSLETGYKSFAVTTTTTQTFVLTGITIPSGVQVNTYINGVRVDGTNTSVPTITGQGTGAVEYITIQSGGAGYTAGNVGIAISAPDVIGGIQATATATVVNGVVTSATIVNPGSGYVNIPYVTISGNSTATVQAYASATLMAEFTETSTTTVFTSITIPSANFTSSDSLVVFRYATSDGTLQITDLNSLDAYIDGGNMSYTTALGLTPSEIILDGGSTSTQFITGMNDDGFLNAFNSPAPEECVPGQIQEAVGISVYTEPYYSSPVIVNKKYWINGTPGTYSLGITPVNSNATIAVFNDTKLLTGQYSIDYADNTFSFNSSNTVTGWLSLTSMQLGSIKLLDSYAGTITNTGTTYNSFVLFDDIGSNGTSTYVTINGSPAVQGVDYTVTANSSTNEAVITFNQLGFTQAYLFGGPVKSFSEIHEQIIEVAASTGTFTLTQPPGNIAPYHSQVIVTKNGLRLNPPVTTYYQVANGQTSFNISQSIIFPNRSIALKRIEVYVNGTLSPVPGIWRLDQSVNQVVFQSNVLSDGDVIAIVVKKNHDYIVQNNQIVLTSNSNIGDEIRITSFTNHDPDFIRTERFKGHQTNQYLMQRPILDSAYVWVSYNGVPLSLETDYSIGTDGYTVSIRNGLFKSTDDDVVITSFASSTQQATSYRIFKDMLGRTHFKRLSGDNITFLTQPLYTTSTSITVNDSSVLTSPSVNTNVPGVILIEGERIEFFTVNGNTLGQLRRSTLGTAPKAVYSTGTLVIDQGVNQTVPFNEVIQVYTTATTTSTETAYTLNGITFNSSAAYSDQVEVYYQGQLLLKPGLTTISHNFDLGYDSTSTADTIVTSQFSINTSSVLTLNFTPTVGATLEVIKRSSQIWYQPNSNLTLSENNTPQVKFLLERSAASPDKYRYE